MITMLMILQASVSILMILSVLLQFGKGAEVGLMGGGASDAVLSGSQRGNILGKITAVLAIIFLVNSLILARLQSNYTSKSILDTEAPVTRPLSSDAKKDAAPAPDKGTESTVPATKAPEAGSDKK
ncbi:MAG: preprotein translocase subunit SecG [Bdellovibrio sp.]|nr:preprotein translocase subunit SecG [Bdellovibrio sp.]